MIVCEGKQNQLQKLELLSASLELLLRIFRALQTSRVHP